MQALAMLTMLIDHLGIVLAPDNPWLRFVGRLAMPLYAYALVLGYARTRSFRRYAVRLAVIAALSQLPYAFALMEPDEPFEFNVVFTLLVSLAVLRLIDVCAGPAAASSATSSSPAQAAVASSPAAVPEPRAGASASRIRTARRLAVPGGIAAGGCLLLELLPFDYGAYLLLLVLIYRHAAGQVAMALHFFLNMLYIALGFPEYQMFSLLASIFVALVPKALDAIDRRVRVPRWLWRSFYPAHLAVLAAIRHFPSL